MMNTEHPHHDPLAVCSRKAALGTPVWVMWLFYGLFFVTGIATVLFGVLLPLLPENSRLPEAVVARAAAMQFGAQIVGPLIVWKRPVRGLAGGALLIAAACALLLFGWERFFMFSLLLYGLGLGIVMTLTNLLVASESPEHLRTSHLELLNVFWPLGAAFCPWWLQHMGAAHRSTMPALFIGTFFLAVAVIACAVRARTYGREERSDDRAVNARGLMLISVLALLAVGLESGVANWMPTFTLRYLGGSRLWVPLATVFWLGILVGRTAASSLLRKHMPGWLVPVCSMLTAGCVLVLMLTGQRWLVYPATALAALAIAPVYPALLGEAVALKGNGVVFACAGVGSALLPWLVGYGALAWHSLHSGLVVLVVAALLLFVVVLVERTWRTDREED